MALLKSVFSIHCCSQEVLVAAWLSSGVADPCLLFWPPLYSWAPGMSQQSMRKGCSHPSSSAFPGPPSARAHGLWRLWGFVSCAFQPETGPPRVVPHAFHLSRDFLVSMMWHCVSLFIYLPFSWKNYFSNYIFNIQALSWPQPGTSLLLFNNQSLCGQAGSSWMEWDTMKGEPHLSWDDGHGCFMASGSRLETRAWMLSSGTPSHPAGRVLPENLLSHCRERSSDFTPRPFTDRASLNPQEQIRKDFCALR